MAGGLDASTEGLPENRRVDAASHAKGASYTLAMPLTSKPQQGAGEGGSMNAKEASGSVALSDPYIASPVPLALAGGPATPKSQARTALRPFRQRVSVKDGAHALL